MSGGILKYAGILLSVLWITALLKKNQELTFILILATSVFMFEMTSGGISELFSLLISMAESAGLDGNSQQIIIKITGIGFITDFCCRLCKDQGQDSLSFQIETAGRVLILLEAVPILKNLVTYMSGILIW